MRKESVPSPARVFAGVLAVTSVTLLAGVAPAHAASKAVSVCKEAAEEAPEALLPLNFEVGATNDPTAPVWTNRKRSLVGVVRVRSGRSLTLQVCTIAAPRVQTTPSRTLAITGNPITLPQGARIGDVQVADRWIAWATQQRSTAPVLVHRRAIVGRSPRTVTRVFTGRVNGIALTPRGTVVVNQLQKGKQRIWTWRPGRSMKLLVPAWRISNDSSAPSSKREAGLSTWEPGIVDIGARDIIEDRLITVDGHRDCTPWDRGANASDQLTDSLRVIVDTSLGWSRRVVNNDVWTNSPESVGFNEHLKICDRNGRRLYATTSGENTYGGDVYTTVGTPNIVGDAVLFGTSSYSGGGGSGNTSSYAESVLVPGRGGTYADADGKVRFSVSTTAAAAWATDDAIWASDATGVRRTALTTDNLRGLRLNGARLIASKTAGSQTIDLSPLPASAVAISRNRPNDANFGQCSGQFAEPCPIPPTDG